MPTLTPAQIITARSYIGVDYAHSDVAGYYNYLSSLGFAYGDLAKGVVQNNTAEGQIANAYAASVALSHGVDLSVGGDAWKQVVFELASRDIDLRDDNSGADLTFEQYDAIHTQAFGVVHLPAETWTAHTPLTNAAAFDPLIAQATWDNIMSGSESSISLLTGGLQLSLSALAVDAGQNPVDFLKDTAAAYKWLANIAVAMYVVGDTEVENLIPTANTQFWTDYNNLKDFFADKYGANIPTAPAWPDGYLDPGIDPTFRLPSDLTSLIQPAFASAIAASSPLVIDLSASHTGVTLTTWGATTTETFFDLNDTGFAVQTAWVSGDTGLLARDLNSNGKIDSSAELFGSPTVDGFAKLAALDSNHDLRIDNNDADWSSLVVWQDANGDAVTQSGELHSLASLGIASIDLAGVAASTSTISGNPISHVSKVTFTSGATAAIDDAWFVHDNTNSYYSGDYTLDVETLFLPALRGYGTLPNITIAMSQDSDLKDLVADFSANFTLASFADADTLKSDITSILYTWAGITAVDPDGRGIHVDGQHLAFLEKMLGAHFAQLGTLTDPGPGAGLLLETAYQHAFDMLAADLLVQVGANSLFADTVTYDPAAGLPVGDTALSQTAIDGLVDLAPAPGAANIAFWDAIARFIDNTTGIANLSGSELTWLDDAVHASDSSRHWTDVVNDITIDVTGSTLNGTSGADTINGGAFNDTVNADFGADTVHGNGGNDVIHGGGDADTLYGDAGNDTLYGEDGNDVIYGGIGNDTLYSGAGNNTLDGGAGGNFLNGESGNETYVYSGGHDVISDSGGTDEITLPSGIVSGDLTVSRVSSGDSYFNDLLISITGAGTIQIHNQFNANNSYHVETIVFADTSTLSLSSLSVPDLVLTKGNDFVNDYENTDYVAYGDDGNDHIALNGSGAHTFDGGLGNDTLIGGSGNDTFIAGPGFDTVSGGGGGTDTIVIPVGFTIDDITFYRVNNASGPTSDLGISINGLGQIEVQSQFSDTSYTVENLHFLEDNSTVSLTGLTITTVGTAGNNSLSAPYYNASANGIYDGREGDDSMSGGSGDNTYVFSAGHDIIYETGGDDTIRVRDHYAPEEITIAFGQGSYYDDKQLILTDSDGNVLTVYNDTGSANSGVEHVVFGDETIWDLSSIEVETHGTSGDDNYLSGHDRGDASSDDTIYGYGGNDQISGGNGNDLLYGGDGDDSIYAYTGYDIAHGDDGADYIRGSDHATLYGDAGNDNLGNASSGSSLVTIYGGDGDDTLLGGYGATIMEGGAGADTMSGWSGAVDTFKFGAATAFDAVDTISNFVSTGTDHDKIDISDVLDGHYDPLTDALTDFVQIQTNGSDSELYVDTSGTGTFGTAQHIATIQYVTGLTDEDALATAGTLIAA